MATLCTQGLEQAARIVGGATTNTLFFQYMAIGCGGKAEASADTKLHQEDTTYKRAAATKYYSSSGGYYANWKHSWGFGAATTVFECGVFTTLSISSSTMLFRHKFASSKSLVAGDSLTITLSCKVSS